MDTWLKGLIAVTCVVVIAGVGLLFWSSFYVPAEYRQVATPKRIEACEKASTDILLRQKDEPFSERDGRLTAIKLVDCEEYGLLGHGAKRAILEGTLAPYFQAFSENRDVWIK